MLNKLNKLLNRKAAVLETVILLLNNLLDRKAFVLGTLIALLVYVIAILRR